MAAKKTRKSVLELLRLSVVAIIQQPIIILPFCVWAFIQLLTLEILYFAPRFPLSVFFAPLIKKLYAETFLHYPFNFVLLPKLFHYVKLFLDFFLEGFLIASSMVIVSHVNSEKRIDFKGAVRKAKPQYVHILVGTLIIALVVAFWGVIFELLQSRAMQIRSDQGAYFLLKRVILEGGPYFNFLVTIFIKALFIYLFVVIVLENRKVFRALGVNFRLLRDSFFFMLGVVGIPMFFYLPVLFLRNNVAAVASDSFPSLRAWVIVLSILVLVVIDAVIYTAATSFYLYRQEGK